MQRDCIHFANPCVGCVTRSGFKLNFRSLRLSDSGLPSVRVWKPTIILQCNYPITVVSRFVEQIPLNVPLYLRYNKQPFIHPNLEF